MLSRNVRAQPGREGIEGWKVGVWLNVPRVCGATGGERQTFKAPREAAA